MLNQASRIGTPIFADRDGSKRISTVIRLIREQKHIFLKAIASIIQHLFFSKQ